jgi:hypothetical protein
MPARSTLEPRQSSSSSFQIVVLAGVVHGAVVAGVTRSGEPLCSFDLAVVDDAGRSLVPLTWRNVEPPEFAEGAALVVRGRVVKRFHRAGAATVARTSVEVDEVIESPKPAAVRRLVARAVDPHGVRSTRSPRTAGRS